MDLSQMAPGSETGQLCDLGQVVETLYLGSSSVKLGPPSVGGCQDRVSTHVRGTQGCLVLGKPSGPLSCCDFSG